MKRIVLMVIIVLALLVMPVIANQAPPVEVIRLAIDTPLMVSAIENDCLALKIEQAVLEKMSYDSNTHLSENLLRRIFYKTAKMTSNGAIMALRGEWLDNIGYKSL